MAAQPMMTEASVNSDHSSLLLVGISGLSQKSTVARILSLAYPRSVIIEADDFSVLDLTKIPTLPAPLSCPDADSAQAVDYERIVRLLDQIRSTGKPDSQYHRQRLYQEAATSFDERLNSSVRKLDDRGHVERLRHEMEKSIASNHNGDGRLNLPPQVTLVILEGFLLFQKEEILKRLDLGLLLQMSKEAAKAQRLHKWDEGGVKSDYWTTEAYFEASTWANYVKEYSFAFVGNNVEGDLRPRDEQMFDIRMTPELDMPLVDILLWAAQQIGPLIREKALKHKHRCGRCAED
jgi:nicotinamide/nicotinate riboside kinase